MGASREVFNRGRRCTPEAIRDGQIDTLFATRIDFLAPIVDSFPVYLEASPTFVDLVKRIQKTRGKQDSNEARRRSVDLK